MTDPITPPFLASAPSIVGSYAGALAEAQHVARTQTADTGKYTYTYADLGDVVDEVKRACREVGLSVAQIPGYDGDRMTVTTVLLDTAGESLTFTPVGMAQPREAQAFGSALTYLRRYALLTIFGIAPEDDDGKTATVAAQTQPGRRSDAERLIRERIGDMDAVERPLFIADFKTHFGVGLSELPVSRHGDALTWTRTWQPPAAADDDVADQAGGPGLGIYPT